MKALIVALVLGMLLMAGCALLSPAAQKEIASLTDAQISVGQKIIDAKVAMAEGKLSLADGIKLVEALSLQQADIIKRVEKLQTEGGVPWWLVAIQIAVGAGGVLIPGLPKYAAAIKSISQLVTAIEGQRAPEGETNEADLVALAVARCKNPLINKIVEAETQ